MAPRLEGTRDNLLTSFSLCFLAPWSIEIKIWCPGCFHVSISQVLSLLFFPVLFPFKDFSLPCLLLSASLSLLSSFFKPCGILTPGVIHPHLNWAGSLYTLPLYILDINTVLYCSFLTCLCLFQSNTHSFWCVLNSLETSLHAGTQPSSPPLLLLPNTTLVPPGDAACSFPRWRGGLLLMLLFGVFSTKLKECSCLIALLMSVGPSPGELLEVYERVPAS